MKILVIDGPGVHPKSSARALGRALHRAGHGVIMHPIDLAKLGWFRRPALEKLAAKVIRLHTPDVVPIFTSEPWVADAFLHLGVSVVHSALDRASQADWIIAPSEKAFAHTGGRGPVGDNRAAFFPYPVEIPDEETLPSDFVLAIAGRKDKLARRWIAAAAAQHPDIPVRFEGDPQEARFVVSMTSREEPWPIGVAEAMAARRAVIAGWTGAASEYVLEGVTGFLSAPGDVQSLASHLRYLWDQPDEAARLGRAGCEEAKAVFGGGEQIRTLMRWYLRAGVSRLAV